MELNIIKQIRTLRNLLKRKPKDVVAQTVITTKPQKPKKPEKLKKPKLTTLVDGKELTLKEIAEQYGIDIRTIKARYKVGNKGKLLIRPVQKTVLPT